MCSLGWGNLVAFDWNDLHVGEFDCKFLKNVTCEPLTLLLYGFACQLLTCKPLFALSKNSSLQLFATANLMQFLNCLVTPIFVML